MKGRTMNPTTQLKRSALCPRESLTRKRILRNVLLGATVLFAAGRLLAGGMSDGVLNFSNTPFLRPQPTIITFDAPGAVNGTAVAGINPAGVITGGYTDANNGGTHLPARSRRHLHYV